VEAPKRAVARQVGLALAMLTRILLLFSIVWVMRLTRPLFGLFGHAFSGRDLILAAGGMFLLWKATIEIHHKLEGPEESRRTRSAPSALAGVILQIALLDIVFSLDSVITAVGMAEDVGVMVAAVVVAVAFMMLSAGRVSAFVSAHPTVKMLALSFLLLIGMSLVAEALGQHIPKGYIYFAMGFSLFVEALNLRARKKPVEPVHLRQSHIPGEPQ
jgi:predicted tellurium resistance membrane protein TerC